MKIRAIASVALLPVLFIIALFLPKIVAAAVVGIMCAISVHELLYTTKLVRNIRMLIYSMVAGFMVSLWSYFGCPQVVAVLGVLVLFGLLFMEMMLSGMKIPFSRVALCFAGGIILPYLLCSLIRILVMAEGRYFILMPFAVACLNDVCAYLIGCKFGKHKLAPKISPKKSVEGFAAGLTAAVLGMVIYGLVLQFACGFKVNYFYAVIYGVVGGLMGVFGDLCFSVIKRQTGIKDYGNIIPGHGGILDRFDSMIVVGPLIEALLLLLPVAVKV